LTAIRVTKNGIFTRENVTRVTLQKVFLAFAAYSADI